MDEIRATITGFDENGESIIRTHHVVPRTELLMNPGAIYWMVWGTPGPMPAVVEEPALKPFFADPGGSRLIFVSFAPAREAGPPSSMTPEELERMKQDAEEKVPGLLDSHEAPDSPWHTSQTIDYIIIMEGELWLRVGDQEQRLVKGDIVVQNNTRHYWENRSNEPAVIAAVIVGIEPR